MPQSKRKPSQDTTSDTTTTPAPKRKKGRPKNKTPDELIADGLWIYDKPSGMPYITRPKPMPKDRPLDLQEIRHYIEYDGLGFCVFSYIPCKKIEDKKLAKMWQQAKDILGDIKEYVYDRTPTGGEEAPAQTRKRGRPKTICEAELQPQNNDVEDTPAIEGYSDGEPGDDRG